nr:MAG TPA: hypothetical protein [Inoviridae sp.]
MERYGNIRFTRRVVAFVVLLFVAINILIPKQFVSAATYSFENIITVKTTYDDSFKDSHIKLSHNMNSPVYSFILESRNPCISDDKYSHQLFIGFVSTEDFRSKCSMDCSDCIFGGSAYLDDGYADQGIYFFNFGLFTLSDSYQFSGSKSDIFMLYDKNYSECFPSIIKYVTTGVKSDGMIIGGSDTKPTAVTNESIGYLQNVKLNRSFITPIKGNNIFETTNYQIYTDMIYNMKWNGSKTSTNYDLSSSYVQIYAKAEYRKDEYADISATDFIELGDYVKASKGKTDFSFMELFEKAFNCKSSYLSDFPLAAASYKDGKLQACSVTPNIKFKFYIRAYKGTDKGPWLCVTEKGSHMSNEFVNSGDDVPYNVSSGDLGADGKFSPDGNVNEDGKGTTGTGKDKDDSVADTNANDKIQSKHESSNTTFDRLEDFVSGIGDVPKIIADIFSFLPSWCLDVIGIGFALLMILIVVKFIRG